MTVTIESARREMSSAAIDIFGLSAEKHIFKIEGCADLVGLRALIFTIANEAKAKDPVKSAKLIMAWEVMGA